MSASPQPPPALRMHEPIPPHTGRHDTAHVGPCSGAEVVRERTSSKKVMQAGALLGRSALLGLGTPGLQQRRVTCDQHSASGRERRWGRGRPPACMHSGTHCQRQRRAAVLRPHDQYWLQHHHYYLRPGLVGVRHQGADRTDCSRWLKNQFASPPDGLLRHPQRRAYNRRIIAPCSSHA